MANEIDQDWVNEHAERIADAYLEDIEYSHVYEDEELEDATEDEWKAIHARIQSLVSVDPKHYRNLVAPYL